MLLNLMLGTGIYLLESMRGRMAGTVEDLRSRAQDTYETATDRVSRAEWVPEPPSTGAFRMKSP